MGIYIKGMEMPKEIEPFIVIDFCEGLDGKRYARFYHYVYGGLTDWHEVLEVPEPHGRLIDERDILKNQHDVILKNGAKHRCFDTTLLSEICAIIEAEEE